MIRRIFLRRKISALRCLETIEWIVDFAVDNIERLEGLLATGRIRADT